MNLFETDVSSTPFLTPLKDLELAREDPSISNSPLDPVTILTSSPIFYDASRIEEHTILAFHDDDYDEEKLVLSRLNPDNSPLFQTPDQHDAVVADDANHETWNQRHYATTITTTTTCADYENNIIPLRLVINSLLWNGIVVEKIPFHTVGGTKCRLLRIQAGGESNHNSRLIQIQISSTYHPSKTMNDSRDPSRYLAQLPLCFELLDPKGRGKSSKPIYISDVVEICMGCQTPAFQAFITRSGQDSIPDPWQCFSIISLHRSYDFYTQTPYEAITFVLAFQYFMLQMNNTPIQTSFHYTTLQNMLTTQEEIMQDAVFLSIRQGDVEQFQFFLEHGFSANHLERGGHRDSPLIAACRFGKSDILQIALQYNAKNDPHPDFGQTALQVAVSSGHEDCVRLLLDTAELSGSDTVIVNHEDSSKEAPIHVASRCGSLAILKLLFLHGANFSVVDGRGNTCLHVAVQGGHVSCVRCILDVSGNSLLDERNDDGFTSTHIAVQMNRIDCLRILIQNEADIRVRTFQGDSALDIARKRKFQKIVHELEKALRGGSHDRIWSRDDLFYDERRHTHMYEDPLFEGLSLHLIDDTSLNRIVTKYGYTDNALQGRRMNDYSLSTSPTDGETALSVNAPRHRSHNLSKAGKADLLSLDTEQITSYPVEKFYDEGVLWFAYLDTSSRIYYVRVKDNFSQWEDPRVGRDRSEIDDHQNSLPFTSYRDSPAPAKYISVSESLGELYTGQDLQPQTAEHATLPCVSLDSKSLHPINISNIYKEAQVDDASTISQNPLEPHMILSRDDDSSKRGKNVEVTSNFHPLNYSSVALDKSPLKLKKLGETFASTTKEKNGDSNINLGNFKILTEQLSSNEKKVVRENAPCTSNFNSETEKYSKMMKIGVPLESVLHKMNGDGVEKDIISQFKLEHGKNTSSIISESRASCPDQSVDEAISKYITMVKVGIPIVAVEMKMKQEQVPDEKVLLWKKAVGQGTKRSDQSQNILKSPIPLLSPPRRPSTAPVKRVANLQKIYWNTVSESKLNDSLWASDEVSGHDNVDVDEIKVLENLFAVKPSALNGRIKNRDGVAEKANTKNVRLIELKRANNIAIALAQFRSFNNYDELCRAVISQDRKTLNVEKLLNMKNLLPTTEELETMKMFHGGVENLGRAELFFLSVSRVPRFNQKLDTFIFISQFSDQVREFEQTSSFLEQACSEIMSSKKLRSILRKLLAVGNTMNERSGTPKAAGITVDSLLNTANKKGVDGKTTVLDHVIANIMKQDTSTNSLVLQEDHTANVNSMSFRDDMPSLCSASKIDVSDLETLMRDLKAGVEKTKHAISTELFPDTTQENHQQDLNNLFINQCRQFLSFADERLSNFKSSMDKLDVNITSVCRFFAEEPKWSQVNVIFSTLIEFAKLVDQSIEKWVRQEKADRRKALLHTPIKTRRESVKPPITPAKTPHRETHVSNDKDIMNTGLSEKVAVIRGTMSRDNYNNGVKEDEEL